MNKETSLYLDLVRFTAAMVVLLGHASGKPYTGGLFWQLGAYLHTAVMIFFVLSGFVIGYVARTREKTLGDYSVARIARLSSIVVPALALTAFSDIVGAGLDSRLYMQDASAQAEGNQYINYLLSLFLLQNVWELGLNPGTNGPFWSLSFEVMYYALFGAAFFLRGKRRIVTLVFLCAVAGPTILALMPIWLMGYGCYRVFEKFESQMSRKTLLFTGLSLAFLGAMLLGGPWVREHVDIRVPFVHMRELAGNYYDGLTFSLHLLFSLPLLAMARPALQHFSGTIKWAASLTFALYLFHRPLIQALAALAPDEPSALSTRIIVIGGTLLIVATFGAWCDKQKHWVKQLLESSVFVRVSRIGS